MACTDKIADMLTRIRNALHAGHKTVSFPASKLLTGLCTILKDEGFIDRFVVIKDNKQGIVKVLLKYKDSESVIQGLKRISKPGLRLYSSSEELPLVLNGLGISIVSTSKGLLTDKQARANKVGGEILCNIW